MSLRYHERLKFRRYWWEIVRDWFNDLATKWRART